jgi:hypothetical protein
MDVHLITALAIKRMFSIYLEMQLKSGKSEWFREVNRWLNARMLLSTMRRYITSLMSIMLTWHDASAILMARRKT